MTDTAQALAIIALAGLLLTLVVWLCESPCFANLFSPSVDDVEMQKRLVKTSVLFLPIPLAPDVKPNQPSSSSSQANSNGTSRTNSPRGNPERAERRDPDHDGINILVFLPLPTTIANVNNDAQQQPRTGGDGRTAGTSTSRPIPTGNRRQSQNSVSI